MSRYWRIFPRSHSGYFCHRDLVAPTQPIVDHLRFFGVPFRLEPRTAGYLSGSARDSYSNAVCPILADPNRNTSTENNYTIQKILMFATLLLRTTTDMPFGNLNISIGPKMLEAFPAYWIVPVCHYHSCPVCRTVRENAVLASPSKSQCRGPQTEQSYSLGASS